MTSYVVSYDLKQPGRDYEPLWTELKRLDGHRTLESLWLVAVTNTATELKDHISKFVDANDAIWVLELTKNYNFQNAKTGTNAWISSNPPSR